VIWDPGPVAMELVLVYAVVAVVLMLMSMGN